MLEVLWARGEIAVVGREGQERVWNLAERWLPTDESNLNPKDVARMIVEKQLRSCGIAKPSQFGFAFDGRPPGWEIALKEAVRGGIAIPVKVEGLKGLWYAHKEILDRRKP